MDKQSAKILDEVCNQRNDKYGDEVLYAAWAEQRPGDKVQDKGMPLSEAVRANVETFMARLCAFQSRSKHLAA